jgi:hypothetical protein
VAWSGDPVLAAEIILFADVLQRMLLQTRARWEVVFPARSAESPERAVLAPVDPPQGAPGFPGLLPGAWPVRLACGASAGMAATGGAAPRSAVGLLVEG